MDVTESNMHQALYGTGDELKFEAEYGWLGTGPISSHEVVSRVVIQISHKGKVEDLTGVVTGVEYDAYEKFRLPEGDPRGVYDWKALEEYEHEQKIKIVEGIKRDYANCDFYEVEFSDNDGSYDTEIEHGPALNNCKNVIRYSHH
jgi:hypothetical protein